MPVVRSNFRGRGQRNAPIVVEFAHQNVDQRANSAAKRHAVPSGEYVEETAGRIAGHENSLSNELPPRYKLADQKKIAEPYRSGPQIADPGDIKPRSRP